MITVNRNNEWLKCTHLIHYTHHNEAYEKYTADLAYWKDFAERWRDEFTLDSVEEVEWSPEQEKRLANIQGFPDGWSNVYDEYVKDGVFHTEDMPHTHPMQLLERKVTSMQQDEMLLDMAIDVQLLRMEVSQ